MQQAPSRRHFLRTLAAGFPAAVAGCIDSVNPQSSTGPSSPTPALTPPTQTPAEGDCSASVPTPANRDGFPAPMEYPEPPADLSVDAVDEFAEQFEEAYGHNSILVELANADCAQAVDASVTSSTFAAVDTGVVGSVTVRRSHTTGGCEKPGSTTETTTPIYADYSPEAVTYYVTDRFVLRNGEPVVCR